MDKIIIQGIKTECIIGDYEWERKKKQTVIFDLELAVDTRLAARADKLDETLLDYHRLAQEVLRFTQASSFHLIETLAEAVAKLCLEKFPIEAVQVRLTKPGALQEALAAIIEIYRKK